MQGVETLNLEPQSRNLIEKPWVCIKVLDMGVSENRGTLFWGPYNLDPTIF